MKKILLILFVGLLGLFQGCQEDEDLRADLDDLINRVTALENTVNTLNETLEGISDLYTLNGGTIKSWTDNGDDYTIILGNDKEITLTKGSDVDGAIIPQIKIENKHWFVKANGGEWLDLGVAVGEDALPPAFSVDDQGFWMIDVNGGTDFVRLKDDQGNDVKAVGTDVVNDEFFDDIKVDEDGNLVITLHGGDPIIVPIVPDFSCAFALAGKLQYFDAGQTKTFEVTIAGVTVGQVIINKPAGWEASLAVSSGDKAILTVTAPADVVVGTRAAANTETDISLLAIHERGFSAMSKIQVTVGTFVISSPTIELGEITKNSIAFTAINTEPDYMTANLKYIIRQTTEIAPTVTEIALSQNITTSGTLVTASGLDGYTEYTIYVITDNGEFQSEVVEMGAMTLVGSINYYENYMAGKPIIINGEELVFAPTDDVIVLMAGPDPGTSIYTDKNVKIIYNVANNSDIKSHIESVKVGTTKKIIFIDNDLTVDCSTNTLEYSTYFIAVNGFVEKLPIIKLKSTAFFKCKSNLYIKNIKLMKTSASGYMFNSTSLSYVTISIEDSEIMSDGNVTMIYDSGTGVIANIIVNNSIINLYNATKKQFYNSAAKVKEASDAREIIKITNSIFYSKDNQEIPLIAVGNDKSTPTPNLNVTVTNNTFYGSYHTTGIMYFPKLASANVTKNIAYVGGLKDKNMYFFSVFKGDGSAMTVSDNRLYCNISAGKWSLNTWSVVYAGASENIITSGVDNPIGANLDLENGYIPSAYTGYGASYDAKKWIVIE